MPGMGELIVILIIVLVIFGANKLPQIGDALGRSIKNFKKASNVEGDDEKRDWLIEVTGRYTVPQIFIGDESIGGYRELAALERSGELLGKIGKKQSSAST